MERVNMEEGFLSKETTLQTWTADPPIFQMDSDQNQSGKVEPATVLRLHHSDRQLDSCTLLRHPYYLDFWAVTFFLVHSEDGWQGVTAKAPTREELSKALTDHEMFM